LESDPTDKEYARPRILSLGKFRVRAIESDRSQIITKRGVGAVEPISGAGEPLGKVFAHAYDLGALTGK